MVRFAAPAAAARAPESATRRGPAGRDVAPPGERLDEVAAVPPADAAAPAEDLAEEEGPAAVDVSSAWAAPAPASATPTLSAPAPSHAYGRRRDVFRCARNFFTIVAPRAKTIVDV